VIRLCYLISNMFFNVISCAGCLKIERANIAVLTGGHREDVTKAEIDIDAFLSKVKSPMFNMMAN
jgi:hypothetical protein